MHADLVKLLDLQARDAAVAEVERRLEALQAESGALDQALHRAREVLEAARRAAVEAARRRDELEAKIETYRVLQDRRQQRLEHVRNPKEASALMAELDLARSVVAKEENDWVRSADAVTQAQFKAAEEERNVGMAVEGQVPERNRLAGRRAELEAELAAARAEREGSASRLDRPLRIRYDRLRKARTGDVIVPLLGGSCGSCHTSIPLNKRSQIKAGLVLDNCEVCGAILYPPEGVRQVHDATGG
jgi:predicted  nucleic acid-binding Zn-ribbon protein